jgi:hypothetical protein
MNFNQYKLRGTYTIHIFCGHMLFSTLFHKVGAIVKDGCAVGEKRLQSTTLIYLDSVRNNLNNCLSFYCYGTGFSVLNLLILFRCGLFNCLLFILFILGLFKDFCQ